MPFTKKHYSIGEHVEIAPHYDLWMRGARLGRIHSYDAANKLAKVRMDNPSVKRLHTFPTADLKRIRINEGAFYTYAWPSDMGRD